VLPQTALPELFGISRVRLGLAQAGAAVANVLMILAMVFCAGIAADLLAPGWMDRRATAAAPAAPGSFDPRASGVSAVRLAAESTVFPSIFPMDSASLSKLLRLPADTPRTQRHPPRRGGRLRGGRAR
jgi:hypothetical protein